MRMDGVISSSPPSSKSHGMGRMLLAAMRLVLGLVFLGWIMMWIMWPTKTYENVWSPKIKSATDSTFLGSQGTVILIFAFPILFIAVAGCVYLHLMQRSNLHVMQKSDGVQLSLKRRLNWAWKRPLIVKGPLGILSAMEVAFCLQYIALVIWVLSVFIKNSFSFLTRKSAMEYYGMKLWEAKLSYVGVYLGIGGSLCSAFLFFPVARGSSLLPLVGLTSESSIKYHIWLGHLVMILFSSHGLCIIVPWASSGQINQMLKWEAAGVSNIAGEIALLAGLILWATTFPRIRRKMFELFFYTHQLYAVFLIFYLLHVGVASFCYILPGVYLFVIDRFLRFLQSRRRVQLLSARLLPSETLELNFAKNPGFWYAPTSVVFVNVPSISKLQWHPFTMSSSSSLEPDMISTVVKKEGSWTQKLYETLSNPSLEGLSVSLEGPYGPASVDLLSYVSLVLVSGGSGITPFFSIIRELIHYSKTPNYNKSTPSIHLIAAFKSSSDLPMLDLLLPMSSSSSVIDLDLQIDAFVTRESSPSPADASPALVRSTFFKPNPNAEPIVPVLGPNGWLWLCAIITASFASYLVIISLIDRYYIYPIDHNTDTIYSYTKRSLLNLGFMCVCVALVAGAAVLWNRRKITEEAKQQSRIMDAPNPVESPGSWVINGASEEMESGPKESLLRAIKVHYGTRPDLKKMLLGCKDKYGMGRIGVMASGPSGLRHEVAEICGSTSAANLHYQSISFTW